MELRKISESEVYLSPLVFGAWAIGGWMWGGADKKDSLNALRESFELGITSIDTAPAYGFGLSEELVGEVIKGKRDKFQILTKCGLIWDKKAGTYHFSTRDNEGHPLDIYKYSGKDSIISECEKSLKRLKTDYIDLYQIHWPDASTPITEPMEAFRILIKQGKIRAAGVSNFNKETIEQALKYSQICSNQVPYSMVNRAIEEELIPFCRKKNISILAYSPLQRGLLTGKFLPGHQFTEGDSRPDSHFYKPENIAAVNQLLDNLRSLANDGKASILQLVIRWTLQQPGITAALVGARNSKQIKETAGALNFELSADEMYYINSKLSLLHLKG